MSLFERLREISLSEREINDIGYGFGKNVNTFFNQGFNTPVFKNKDAKWGRDRVGGDGIQLGERQSRRWRYLFVYWNNTFLKYILLNTP